eukprot:TRINITY_DN1579_c1_g1_i1.p1 TRINITY_DN1579_c1_g1~~TRINITY_DN1579_c1_g1_i1.p1  ORF type:complete len:2326 (-),score=648.42 TRINITY_DN1579_c1_g1_i1:972-7490(-)
MKALDIAKSDKRYQFLVYNASVLYWQLARPLMRAGSRQHLLPSLEAFNKALDDSQEADMTWRTQLAVGLAFAQDDAGKADDAVKTITIAATHAAKASSSLQLDVFCNQVYLCRNNTAAVGKLKSEAASSPLRRAALVLQLIRAGTTVDKVQIEKDLAEARTALQQLKTPASTTPAATAPAATGGKKPAAATTAVPTPQPPQSPDKQSSATVSQEDTADELLAQTAFLAASSGLNDMATEVCQSLLKTASVPARAYVEYTHAVIILNNLGAAAERYVPQMISARLDALKKFERALAGATRYGDAVLLQDGAVLVWNAALPLLQPNLRHQTRSALERACNCLEAIQSPLHELRALLHTELAKIDQDADLASGAATHVTKALKLDYNVDKAVQDRYGMQFPLDRHLKPLSVLLKHKLDVYHAPERLEDQAMLFVSQARDSKEVPVKQTVLTKAISTLMRNQEDVEVRFNLIASKVAQQAEAVSAAAAAAVAAAAAPAKGGKPAAPKQTASKPGAKKETAPTATDQPADDTLTPAEEEVRLQMRERVTIFAEIAKTAWQSHLLAVTQQAGPRALLGVWDPIRDAELCITQAQVHTIMAETYILELNQEEVQLGDVLDDDEDDTDFVEWAHGLQQKVVQHILNSLQSGLKLKEDWLVANACIYILNYHNHLCLQNRHFQLVETLQQCLDGLMAMGTRDIPLVCTVANALARALEQTFLNSKHIALAGDDLSISAPRNLDHTVFFEKVRAKYADKLRDAKAADLERAEKICETVLPLGLPHQTRDLVITMARIQMLRNGAVAGKGSPETQVLFQLEAVRHAAPAGLSAAVDKAVTLLNAVKKPPDSNRLLYAEMQARTAEAALQANDLNNAIKNAQQSIAVMPADAKHVTDREWRWYALAESAHGRALAALVSPEKQLPSYQDKLRVQASTHFVTAGKYSVAAGFNQLAQATAENFWNTCVPLAGTRGGRKTLLVPLNSLLLQLDQIWQALDPDLTIKLYQLLFDCHSDIGQWREGLKAVERAFAHTPEENHKTLWEYRIVYLNKLGKNIVAELAKVKTLEPRLRAKVFATAARTSTSADLQLDLYHRAIDALEQHPLDKVEYMIEISEWMYKQGHPVQDSEDMIQSALDLLLDTEQSADPTADDNPDSERSMGRSVRSSTRRSRSRSSPVSRGTRLTRRLSGSTNVSRLSATMAGKGAQFTVQHMLFVVRCYIMLSSLHGDCDMKVEDLLVAFHYVERVWDASIDRANRIDAEDKGADPETHKPFVLPTTLQGWTTFTMTDELRTRIKGDRRLQAINARCVDKPELLIHYLDNFIDKLIMFGYHLYTVPVLHLLQVVAADVLQSPQLVVVVKYRMAFVLEQLNLLEESKKWLDSIGSLQLSDVDKRKYREEVDRQIELMGKGAGSMEAATAVNATPSQDALQLQPLSIRQIWTKQAKWLIDYGEYKVAKELLLEVHMHSTAYEDKQTLRECLHLLALLAFREGDLTKAVQLQTECQQYSTGFQGWFDAAKALATYLWAGQQRLHAAEVLQKAIHTFDRIASSRPNAAMDATRYASLARARLAMLLYEANSVIDARLLFDTAMKSLAVCGANLDSAHTGMQYAEMLIREADSGLLTIVEHKEVLGTCAVVLTYACERIEEVMKSVNPPPVSEPLILPTSRIAARIQLQLSDALLRSAIHMSANPRQYRIDVQEIRFPESGAPGRDAVERFLDTGRDARSLDELGRAEKALLAATTARSLCPSVAMQPEATLQLGQCLAFLAAESGQLDDVWKQVAPPVAVAASAEAVPASGRPPSRAGSPTGRKSPPAAARKATSPTARARSPTLPGRKSPSLGRTNSTARSPSPTSGARPSVTSSAATLARPQTPLRSNAVDYAAQALTALNEAAAAAQHVHRAKAIGAAAETLLRCLGAQQTAQSVPLLCTYQSCAVSEEMLRLVDRSRRLQHREAAALALLRAIETVHGKDLYVPKMDQVKEFLASYAPAWKCMSVEATYEEALAALPPDTLLMVLQLSPSHKEIYGAIIPPNRAEARIARMEINMNDVEYMMRGMKTLNDNLSKIFSGRIISNTVAKSQIMRTDSRASTQIKLDARPSIAPGKRSPSPPPQKALFIKPDAEAEEYKDIVTRLNDLLSPLFDELKAAMPQLPPAPIDDAAAAPAATPGKPAAKPAAPAAKKPDPK